MRLEIVSAADFLVQLLRLQAGSLTEVQLQQFKGSLQDVLRRRYRDHWFPDKPNRGSGYRCLRINGKMDPVIAQAGAKVGLLPGLLHGLFPSELTMWIDPSEVSYRIGENGSICVLFEGSATITAKTTSDLDDEQQQQQRKIPVINNSNKNEAPPSPISAHPALNRLNQHYHHGSRTGHHFKNHHNNQQHHYQSSVAHYNTNHQQQPQYQQGTTVATGFESCKDSLMLEHQQFNEQIAAFVSS